MSNIIKTTGDNSPTLFSEKFGVHYHSVHGAMTETEIVFIETGLRKVAENSSDINILEVGFGSGLNCFATLKEMELSGYCVFYTALEKYPVDFQTAKNFGIRLDLNHEDQFLFEKMHEAEWEKKFNIFDRFALTKMQLDFMNFQANEDFDLIYFDAFAPETQPELWTVEMFELMAKALKIGGVLTTYCAKGYVKRNLKAAGFSIEALPGPPGKREITRATKL